MAREVREVGGRVGAQHRQVRRGRPRRARWPPARAPSSTRPRARPPSPAAADGIACSAASACGVAAGLDHRRRVGQRRLHHRVGVGERPPHRGEVAPPPRRGAPRGPGCADAGSARDEAREVLPPATMASARWRSARASSPASCALRAGVVEEVAAHLVRRRDRGRLPGSASPPPRTARRRSGPGRCE